MTPRLAVEEAAVRTLLERTTRARLERLSLGGTAYEIVYDVHTLVRDGAGIVREARRAVPVLFDLALDHPRVAPVVVAAHEDLFNPHIRDPRQPSPLPPIPLVCLGRFRVEQRVADWVAATYYLLGWARIAVSEWLNPLAADYARLHMHSGRLPVERRDFIDVVPAAGAVS